MSIVKGRNRDTAWYAGIYLEWSQIKLAFNLWLNDTNFGPEGIQLKSLSDLTRSIINV